LAREGRFGSCFHRGHEEALAGTAGRTNRDGVRWSHVVRKAGNVTAQ